MGHVQRAVVQLGDTPLVTLVLGRMTHYAAVDGSEEEQRYRSKPVDIPGQWTCQACGQERVWPVKTRCFRCGCPKGHVPPQPESFLAGPLTRLSGHSVRTRGLFPPMV